METDNAVREEPDAFEQGIAAQQPTDGRARDVSGLENLGPHGCARRTTECSEERRADILDYLALELYALALGFLQIAGGRERFLTAEVFFKLFARLTQTVDGQRRMREPVRVRAEQYGIKAGKRAAQISARDEREGDERGLARILLEPPASLVDSARGGCRSARDASAAVISLGGSLVITLRAFERFAGFFSGGLGGAARCFPRFARTSRGLFGGVSRAVTPPLLVAAEALRLGAPPPPRARRAASSAACRARSRTSCSSPTSLSASVRARSASRAMVSAPRLAASCATRAPSSTRPLMSYFSSSSRALRRAARCHSSSLSL